MTKSVRPLLWLLLLGLCSHAQAGEWSLSVLMTRLSVVDSRQAVYTEERHSSLLGVPLISRGELLYRAPDYLKKTVAEGGEGSYEITGGQLRIDEAGEVRELPLTAHPALQAFVASFRATLAGDLATLQRYYRLRLSGDEAAWVLTLEPTESSMASVIREVTIQGSGAWLQRVETLEAGGDSTIMVIRSSDG